MASYERYACARRAKTRRRRCCSHVLRIRERSVCKHHSRQTRCPAVKYSRGVVARYADVSGISRSQVTVGSTRRKSHNYDVLNAVFEGLPGRAKIPGIFSPERAEPCLHHIAGRGSGEPHAVAPTESVPVGSILVGSAVCGGKPCGKQAAREAYRSHSALCNPIQSLMASDRTVIFVLRSRNDVVLWVCLTCSTSDSEN